MSAALCFIALRSFPVVEGLGLRIAQLRKCCDQHGVLEPVVPVARYGSTYEHSGAK
jgi:hypothetical protein